MRLFCFIKLVYRQYMKTKDLKIVSTIALMLMVSACNDTPSANKEPEPVDEQATQVINDKLLDSMQDISNQHSDQIEDTGKNALRELSESDRQSLIDLTIDESSKPVADDAEKMIDLLEDINGVSE